MPEAPVSDPASPEASAVVVYDGACQLCAGGVAWVARRARRGEFEFLPCQAAERRARFPWMEDRVCMEAIQLIMPDGRVLAGAAALPELMRRLRGWRWLATLLELPGVDLLAPRVYAWIARHRYRISTLLRRRHDRSA